MRYKKSVAALERYRISENIYKRNYKQILMAYLCIDSFCEFQSSNNYMLLFIIDA